MNLDRVLLHSSLVLECLVEAARQHPTILLRLPFWALRGKGFVNEKLAQNARLDVARLHYREEASATLHRMAADGNALGVITTASEFIAKRVAEYLGLIGPVVGSTAAHHVPSAKMRQELSHKLGPSHYDLVTAPREVPALGHLVRLLRPVQWLKNTLVFLPFLLSHRVSSLRTWVLAFVAFLAFSMCASCGYVINDVLDRHQDRRHPRRRFRPVASGEVTLGWALSLTVPLLLVACLCCSFLPWECAAVLCCYLATTCFYTAVAKGRLMADVIILSLLYTLRLVMGSLATGNVVSSWLAGFSLTLFLSLALCKRVSELIGWRSVRDCSPPGRGYVNEDTPVLEMMAVSSGFLACLVMMLYLQTGEVLQLYQRPQYLWMAVVGLFYWLGRLMIWTHRGKCPDDPLLFVLRDKTTMLVLAAAGVCVLLAI